MENIDFAIEASFFSLNDITLIVNDIYKTKIKK